MNLWGGEQEVDHNPSNRRYRHVATLLVITLVVRDPRVLKFRAIFQPTKANSHTHYITHVTREVARSVLFNEVELGVSGSVPSRPVLSPGKKLWGTQAH